MVKVAGVGIIGVQIYIHLIISQLWIYEILSDLPHLATNGK